MLICLATPLDKGLSEKLQMDAKLSVETAKTTIRKREAVKEQQSLLLPMPEGTKANPITLDSIRQRGANGRYRQYRKHRDTSKPGKPGDDKRTQDQEGAACSRCGRRPMHSRQHCPAKDAECHRCHKRGHYGTQCRTKDIRNVDAEEDSHLCSAYLDTLTEDQSSTWSASVAVGRRTLIFKVDTGAEVTAISESAFHELEDVVLEKPTKKLYMMVLAGPHSR